MTATLDHRVGQIESELHDSSVGAVSNLPEGQCECAPHVPVALGESTPSDHPRSDSHVSGVAGLTSPSTRRSVRPKRAPSTGITATTSDQSVVDDQGRYVAGGFNSDASQNTSGTHAPHAGVGSNSPAPIRDAPPTPATAQGPDSPDGQSQHAPHRTTAVRGPILRDPLLALLAETVDDLEKVRIASDNRYRQLTRDENDSDGELRGLGLNDSVPEVKRARVVADSLAAVEHQAVLNLQRQMRKHPLWSAWGKDAKGVGEKQLARLLAAIGDPYWNDLHDRPRAVSELWAYCGFHVIDSQAPRKAKGGKVNWSQAGRMRAWNIAGACLKAQGHYSEVYYAAREKYADATHPAECMRCGPKGKPALPGSALSDGHKHARALRMVAKTVLLDMWAVSQEIHQHGGAS